MLSIQPKFSTNYRPAFKSNEQNEDYSSISLNDINDEDTYESVRDNLNEQKNNFVNLANDKEFEMPKFLKKGLEGGAVITTGLLGGMATGWGTKKSLQGFSRLSKTAPVKNFFNYIKNTGKFIKKTFSTIKKDFLASDVYQKPANAIKKQYNKFAKTKIGAPITKFFSNVKDGVSTIYKNIRKGLKSFWEKVKGVKKETYEKAAVNTVGVSGGIASGVTAVKETQEKNKKEAAEAGNDIYDDGEE